MLDKKITLDRLTMSMYTYIGGKIMRMVVEFYKDKYNTKKRFEQVCRPVSMQRVVRKMCRLFVIDKGFREMVLDSLKKGE